MEMIFNEQLLNEKIAQIQLRALSLNESQLNSIYNKYPRDVFSPLNDYLTEAFYDSLIKKGKDFASSFAKNAKAIATKVATAVKEFSFKKVFATISKMMQKIKAKILKELILLFEPLRGVIINLGFSNEDNKFEAKKCFAKLVSIAKSSGKDVGSEELLNDTVVSSMGKNINLSGTEALTESFLNEFKNAPNLGTDKVKVGTTKVKTNTIEDKKGAATFNTRDVKYLDFFQKMMFKLGIKDAKLNGFFSEITKKVAQGAAITGIFAVLGALLPSMGIVTAIAGAAGAAIAAAPILVMIIGAIIFGIGLFMFATWLLKPYPTVKDCETFLASIFDGSNVFDYPESNIGDISNTAVSIKKLKKVKPAFNNDVIIDLEEDGVEEDIPGTSDGDYSKIVKLYDDLDIDTLEDQAEVTDNIIIVRKFVRNIFTPEGRKKVNNLLEDDIDENQNDYSESLQELLNIIDECIKINATEKDKSGKKKFPFAINSQKMQAYLTDSKNTAKERLAKIIDSVDNFIDRVDNDKQNK